MLTKFYLFFELIISYMDDIPMDQILSCTLIVGSPENSLLYAYSGHNLKQITTRLFKIDGTQAHVGF
jgi:hypothetical protein